MSDWPTKKRARESEAVPGKATPAPPASQALGFVLPAHVAGMRDYAGHVQAAFRRVAPQLASSLSKAKYEQLRTSLGQSLAIVCDGTHVRAWVPHACMLGASPCTNGPTCMGVDMCDCHRMLLLSSARPCHMWAHMQVGASLPPWDVARGDIARSMQLGIYKHSYGHRQNAGDSKKRALAGAQCAGCANQAAQRCVRSMCAICCDGLWWKDTHGGAAPTQCPAHQAKDGPQSLGGCLLDEYDARVDDPAAFMEEFLNTTADQWVRTNLAGKTEVTVSAVLWTDGGTSGGQNVIEWCCVLVDDSGRVFDCTVSELTRLSFCRFITAKGKCDATGLASTVGPLLRSVVDLGLHGVVHRGTGCVLKVRMDALVADMDAHVRLVGKVVSTPAHCPWCDAALESCRSKGEQQHGPWGDLQTGCGGAAHGNGRRYGRCMATFVEKVLPLVQQNEGRPPTQWKAATGLPFRTETGGQGHERPALYQYHRRVVPTSPSKWGQEAAGRGSSSTRSCQAGVYVPAHQAEDSQSWDVWIATAPEHEFAEDWVDTLQLIPDEMHITQRLIEGWRDAVEACAVLNGQRQQGSWAFRALWARAARMDVFIRNWRTYHLRVALGMSITQDTCRTMAPAVLVVVGQSLTGLVHYMKHDPDARGAPCTAAVPCGPHAAVYSQISACVLAFSIWLLCTLTFPKDIGRRLHLHALWELIRLLATHPWVMNRSCEWGEHSFYTESTARHVAPSQVLGVLALHRWGRSMMWGNTRAPTSRGQKFIKRTFQAESRPLPFPVIPDAVAQFDRGQGGHLWTRLQHALKPLLDKHGMEWAKRQSPAGHHVWIPVAVGASPESATSRTADKTAEACMNAIGRGLQAVPAFVGAPHSKGRRKAQVRVHSHARTHTHTHPYTCA